VYGYINITSNGTVSFIGCTVSVMPRAVAHACLGESDGAIRLPRHAYPRMLRSPAFIQRAQG